MRVRVEPLQQEVKGDMKVTGYRVLRTFREWGRPIGDVNGHIASGITEEAVVLVDTDAGITGVGTGHAADLARLFPAIEGQDPRAVTALYDRMLARVFKAGHAGATFGSIGAFDMALWDIKAKAAGEPLWRLLGGRDRFVTGYASGLDIALSDEELAAFYAQMADLGFSSGKLKGGRDLDADRRRLHIVRDAMGRNSRRPAVMFDANESWNLKQAVRYISELERDIDLTWVEEPLRRWDAEGHARLSRSIRAAVATGENLSGLEQFRPIMDAGGVDVVQVGCTWGVTHFLRVAILAHGRDLPISPVGVTANQAVAHAALAVPNHLSAEVQDLGAPFGLRIDQHFADGGIVLGDTPGHGVSVDEALIAEGGDRGASWLVGAGPHVRPDRAGLRLVPEVDRDERPEGRITRD